MRHCIVCGSTPVELHHWPRTKATGGKVTVPLCREHHVLAHTWHEPTIEAICEAAPRYWHKVGVWEEAGEVYVQWCTKQEYKDETKWGDRHE
jgi:hypothetical protein